MIAIASDHGGFELKQEVMKLLSENTIEFKDFGTYSRESCDYPEMARPAVQAVATGECGSGILICSTGVGMSIAANRTPGVRAALCTDTFTAEMCRLHNDANILVLGALVTGRGLALKIVEKFMQTGFEGGRHSRRVAMLG